MVEKKIIPIRLSLVLSLILFSQCTSNVPDVLAPERILHNGKIVTVDQDFSDFAPPQKVVMGVGRSKMLFGTEESPSAPVVQMSRLPRCFGGMGH